MESEHLGDGVYLSDDGYQLWLSVVGHDRIALEPDVFQRLCERGAARFKAMGEDGTK